MDKKKLAKYTEWAYRFYGSRSPKSTAKEFLRQNPGFFDEPNPFDELFEARENQSQTGSFEITFKFIK